MTELDRSHKIEIVTVEDAKFFYEDDVEMMLIGDELFRVTGAALDTILNMLKIPIKYFHRTASLNADVSAANMNLWLTGAEDIGAVVQDEDILQFFDSRRLFLPTAVVKQAVCNHLGLDERLVFDQMENGTYIGTFPVPHSESRLADGSDCHIYIRIQFSDCFEIVPRIDYAVTYDKTFESFYFPLKGRKLRIAGSGAAQIVNQITEFVDLVLESGTKTFVPALNEALLNPQDMDPQYFADRICTDLRLSRKIGAFLIDGVEQQNVVNFFKVIGSKLLPEVRPEMIDLDTARAIEISMSKFITTGSFK